MKHLDLEKVITKCKQLGIETLAELEALVNIKYKSIYDWMKE